MRSNRCTHLFGGNSVRLHAALFETLIVHWSFLWTRAGVLRRRGGKTLIAAAGTELHHICRNGAITFRALSRNKDASGPKERFFRVIIPKAKR